MTKRNLRVERLSVLYYNRIILRSQKAGAEIVIRVYHGSDHIIKIRSILAESQIMIMEMDFIQQNLKTEQEAGLH